MMDARKVSDDEMLQDLQMLPEGGKEVYFKYFLILNIYIHCVIISKIIISTIKLYNYKSIFIRMSCTQN